MSGLILLAWATSLLGCLLLQPQQLPAGLLGPAVLLRTFLHTGLFIVGHDAMHGTLVPRHRPLNDLLGALVLGLYAALPFRSCRAQHRRHHRATASAHDPDVHPDPGAGVLAWYTRFMAGYLSLPQMACLLAGWALLGLGASRATPAAWANVLLFCTLPLVLSSAQLFLFGTYLPHRDGQRGGHCGDGSHQVRSLRLPPWLSLLACYHFGYHLEHHVAPQLAWYELPRFMAKGSRRPTTGH
jgi:beta-carotene ketolase (CrtW type)